MTRALETGIRGLDTLLEGGYPPKKLTLIYGEEESGKTSLALRASVSAAKKKRKTLWIDCGGLLHPERLMQVALTNNIDAENILLIRPKTFDEQRHAVEKTPLFLSKKLGLIVFENYNVLHRVSATMILKENRRTFKDLSFQLAYIKNAAITHNLPVITTAQVHEALDEVGKTKDTTRPAATRISLYWPDIVIRTKNLSTGSMKILTVEKGIRKRRRDITFRITDAGVTDTAT